MGARTAIEWADHTFNPWIGCAKVSEACRHCYAESFANRYHPAQGLWGVGGARRRTAPSTWAQPRRWHRAYANAIEAAELGIERPNPRPRVFCGSLCDIFEIHADLDPIRADLWRLIEETPALCWMLLTKRPENISAMFPSAFCGQGRLDRVF